MVWPATVREATARSLSRLSSSSSMHMIFARLSKPATCAHQHPRCHSENLYRRWIQVPGKIKIWENLCPSDSTGAAAMPEHCWMLQSQHFIINQAGLLPACKQAVTPAPASFCSATCFTACIAAAERRQLSKWKAHLLPESSQVCSGVCAPPLCCSAK